MWEFSVGLYMIRIWPNSLLFAAIYGVVESSSVAVFGPMVGTLVDSLTYLQVRQPLLPSGLSSLSPLCFKITRTMLIAVGYYLFFLLEERRGNCKLNGGQILCMSCVFSDKIIQHTTLPKY